MDGSQLTPFSENAPALGDTEAIRLDQETASKTVRLRLVGSSPTASAMEKLEKRLRDIVRFGMFPVVLPAPKGAVTFDRMIVTYLDDQHRRMYQVFFYN